MRAVVALPLTLALAVPAFLPRAAHAQNRIDLPYSDANGGGTLTLNLGIPPSNTSDFRPMTVILVRNQASLLGSGVALDLQAVTEGRSGPAMLLAFNLVSANGRVLFYQGQFLSVNGYTGGGTYSPVDSPQVVSQWRVIPNDGGSPPPAGVILNSTPRLNQGWTRNAVSDPVGGISYFTNNTLQSTDSTAIWEGALPPVLQNYQVEVFIPAQSRTALKPRTNRARYTVFQWTPPMTGLAPRVEVNQQVTSSQWVSLGTFPFQGRYQVVLGDDTGEPQQSRYVVAGALRLTPVGSTGTP
jgi:hypothetical protein